MLSTLPRLIGHRGAKESAPENTLASLREAARQGARWVEVDVMLTRDHRPVLIHANTRLILASAATEAPRLQAISPDIVSRELAWREGKIAFEGERLEQAAAEFARYSKTHIEIRDPALAREPVTGLFSASDPLGSAAPSRKYSVPRLSNDATLLC